MRSSVMCQEIFSEGVKFAGSFFCEVR